MSRAYELVDARHGRDERYIGFGAGERPWLPLWENREVDGSPLGAWLRDLDASGLQPVEDHTWLPAAGMTAREARAMAAARVRQIIQWAGGWPNWLLDCRGAQPWPTAVCCYRDGELVATYPSIRAAARAAGIWPRAMQERLASGCEDYDGCTWVRGCPTRQD
jgi:hypothetical protein